MTAILSDEQIASILVKNLYRDDALQEAARLGMLKAAGLGMHVTVDNLYSQSGDFHAGIAALATAILAAVRK